MSVVQLHSCPIVKRRAAKELFPATFLLGARITDRCPFGASHECKKKQGECQALTPPKPVSGMVLLRKNGYKKAQNGVPLSTSAVNILDIFTLIVKFSLRALR